MLAENIDYSEINFDEMAASIGLKPKHLPMLIGVFLEESVTILNNLELAIKSRDYPSIKLHAHSLKGSSGNLKFNELYEMAKEMEFAAAEENEAFEYSRYLEVVQNGINTVPN
jgi:HPt (histidine-containing phosphotransfer) domain-containing protein